MGQCKQNPPSTWHEIAFFFSFAFFVYCFAANVKLEGEQERRIPTFGDDAHRVYL